MREEAVTWEGVLFVCVCGERCGVVLTQLIPICVNCGMGELSCPVWYV